MFLLRRWALCSAEGCGRGGVAEAGWHIAVAAWYSMENVVFWRAFEGSYLLSQGWVDR
jgi:hypothetical protein